MPLEEVGWHALLRRGVYVPDKLFWANSGGGICLIHLVGAEDRGILTTEGVGLGPHELVAVGVQRRHEAWTGSGVSHDEEGFHAR